MQSDSSDITTSQTNNLVNNNTITAQIQQQPQHSNIYLLRGARTENGHLILQNSHELLSLLNDDDKPILLQHPKIKNKTSSESAILFQPTIKTTTMENPILLQTQAIKKSGNSGEGSIILQQRINKAGGTDGPIFLQTLKRLDKTQPIWVLRSASNTTTTATTTSAKTQSQQQQQAQQQTSGCNDDGVEEKRNEQQPQKSVNIPLGSGKYKYYLLYSSYCLNFYKTQR